MLTLMPSSIPLMDGTTHSGCVQQTALETIRGTKSHHSPFTPSTSHPLHCNSHAIMPSRDHIPNAFTRPIPQNSTHIHAAMGFATPTISTFITHEHTRHHINTGIAGHYNPPTLTQLFSTKKGVVYLMDFLKMSNFATKPECGPEPPV